MRASTVSAIVEAHRKRAVTPAETIRRCYARIQALDDPGIFITLRNEHEAIGEAGVLNDKGGLYGVPVVVKDNIDVAGMPTTAACPAFAYQAEEDAEAIRRLKCAGAIVIGKDQSGSICYRISRTAHALSSATQSTASGSNPWRVKRWLSSCSCGGNCPARAGDRHGGFGTGAGDV